MAVDDVYMLAIEAVLNGRPVVNTFAFRRKSATAITAANLTTLADALVTRINNAQVDDLQWLTWRATEVRGAGATYSTTAPFLTTTVAYSGTITGTPTGELTGTPLPNNVALVVKVQSDQSGRRRQGRFFIGGIPEVWVDDNSLFNSTQLATLQTQLDFLEAAYKVGGTDTDWEMGVYSMRTATNAKYVWTTGGPVLTSQGSPSPSTAFIGMQNLIPQSFVGSQRDRRPGL